MIPQRQFQSGNIKIFLCNDRVMMIILIQNIEKFILTPDNILTKVIELMSSLYVGLYYRVVVMDTGNSCYSYSSNAVPIDEVCHQWWAASALSGQTSHSDRPTPCSDSSNKYFTAPAPSGSSSAPRKMSCLSDLLQQFCQSKFTTTPIEGSVSFPIYI